MSKGKWDEEKVKKVLEHMPDIQDTRTKEEVLSRLKLDERLKGTKRKNPKRWMPAFVAIAALIVLALILPSMLGGENKASDSSALMDQSNGSKSDNASLENAIIQEVAEVEEQATMGDVSRYSRFSTIDDANYSPAVYVHDTVDGTVFHLGLASDAASSIPVTFVIPNSQIQEDFGKLEPTSLELYEKYADQLDEEALGFYEYHPYKGKISADKDILIHTLPSGHGYDMAPGTMGVYEGTLQDTFYGFREIIYHNEDDTIVEFDQVGEPSKPLKLASGINHYNYYLIKQENGKEYLSSNFSKSFDTLEEALQEMKLKPNDIYSPVIPKNINFTVTKGKGLTKVKFTKALDLELLDPVKALQMVEGLLMTAASFDERLQFENVVQAEWNEFDFSKPLEKPIGPNGMALIVK